MGRNGRGRTSLVWAALAAGVLVAVACASPSDDPAAPAGASTESTPPPTPAGGPDAAGDEPPPCAENRHAVVVDMDGTLTAGAAELETWQADPTYDPELRPGANDLMRTWRALGYEVVYLTERPADIVIGDTPIAGATQSWLERHEFPAGERTHLFVWDTEAYPTVDEYKVQTLINLGLEDLAVDYGYTDTRLDVIAYRTAGIAADQIFTVGEAAGEDGTVPVREPGWLAHQVTAVESLPPVCAE